MADIQKRVGKRGTTYRVRYRDHTGKLAYSESFERRKDAADFRDALSQTRAAAKRSAGLTAETVGEAIDHWLDVVGRIGRHGREPVERKTLTSYKSHAKILRILKVPQGAAGAIRLADLHGPTCQAVRAALLTAHGRAYAGKIWRSFRSALAQAVESGLLTADPSARMMIVSASRFGGDDRVEIPTVAQMQAILATAQACRQWSTGQRSDGNVRAAWRRYHRLILLAVFSGLRPSELRGLSWRQVELDAGKIEVTQRADEYGVIGAVKTANALRTVYLPVTVIEELKVWRRECPISPAHLVFPSAQGNPLPLGNIHRRAWEPLLERAEVVDAAGEPAFAFYACRHFYASALIAQKVGEGLTREAAALAIAEAMGHSSPAFTMQVYGHLFPKDESVRRAQAAALEATLLGPSPEPVAPAVGAADVPSVSQRDKRISYIKAVP